MSRFGALPAKLLRKTCLVEALPDRLPVYTLTFANPSSKPGGLGVRMDFGDIVKIMIPNFKPKSYSMSDERPGEFDITFKVYPGGRCSGYLDSIQIGGSVDVFRMGKKERFPGARAGIIAYGVGITEALPMAEAELSKPDAQQVSLLWASKTHGDTFWHQQLAALAEAHPERFTLTTILSREERAGALFGRVSPAVLSSVFDQSWGTHIGGPNESSRSKVRFLSVGTKEMMKETDQMLQSIGYPMPQHALLSH